MLIQICKICGFSPIVAVVGASHKVAVCEDLGADVVVDKSRCPGGYIWGAVERASPKGYIAVFDATGVETLAQSYSHLTQCGR
jgi:synaptic vesicle membrane protein VAT-1